MISKAHFARALGLCALGAGILVSLAQHASSAATVIPIPFEAKQAWGYFDNGWQAYHRDDLVEAYRSFGIAWLLFGALQGHAESPFPPDEQFREQFAAVLEYTRGELIYFSQKYPGEARTALEDVSSRFSDCQAKLSLCGNSSREKYSGDFKPGRSAPRPPKPKLPRVPPPGQL